MNKYTIEYCVSNHIEYCVSNHTDTLGGEATYCLWKRATIEMPEETKYGCKYKKAFKSALMKRAKAKMGLAGVRGKTEDRGDYIAFIPYGRDTVMYVNPGTLGQSYLRHW